MVEQSKRKGARLNTEERRQFVLELAVGLWEDDRQTRHYREFGDLLRTRFQLDDAAQVDYLRSDVQNCTFLTRDVNGNYGFRHRSFLEFFVARAIVDAIHKKYPDLLSRKVLSIEIRGFVVDMLDAERVEDTLKVWIAEPNNILRENALALASLLKVDLPQALLRSIGQKHGDVLLAASLVQGDSRAFEDLYLKYADLVRRYIRSLGGESYDADDLLTDVFLRVWRKGEDLEQIQNLDAYILRVTRNVFIDSRRVQRRQGVHFVDLDSDVLKAWEAETAIEHHKADNTTDSIDIHRLLARLPDDERELLRRYIFERESVRKIAVDMGLSPRTVSIKYKRIVTKLQAFFKNENSDDGDIIEA